MPLELFPIRSIHCAGAPRDLGRAQGEAARDSVRGFITQRLDALREYLAERGSVDVEEFLRVGERCLAQVESWDPDGHAEHMGIAEGAGVAPAELYAISNMTDMRDVLLLGAGEGCSSFILPAELTRERRLVAGQTWDLNPSDLDYVLAVHRLPDRGPETWTITCVGSLTLMGMNQHGLAIGTTNIKAHRSRVGVGYLSVIHRAIRAAARENAQRIIEEAPRAAAHTYWLADGAGGVELECSSELCVTRALEQSPLVRTNHCLSAPLRKIEGEKPTSSSKARLDRMQRLLLERPHDPLTLRAVYANRDDGVDSICRYPEDGQGTATNACLICEPATRRMWACRGPADRGSWQEFCFERV